MRNFASFLDFPTNKDEGEITRKNPVHLSEKKIHQIPKIPKKSQKIPITYAIFRGDFPLDKWKVCANHKR